MRRFAVSLMIGVLASGSFAGTGLAQTQAAAPPVAVEADTGDFLKTLAVGVGVVGGLVAVDLLTGGTLTGPLFGTAATQVVVAGPVVYPPAVLEARAAGAVLGEMIVPATQIRDNAARADMLWVAALTAGAVGGGYLVNWALASK